MECVIQLLPWTVIDNNLDTMIKISQVNAVYGRGSTGTIVKDLQRRCKEEKIWCETVFSQSYCPVEVGYQIGNKVNNAVHSIMSRIDGKQGYYSHLSTFKLLRHYNKLKPDIIHLHNLHSSFINLPMLLRYAAQNDIAVVATLHDCWFYTGGCTHYTHSNCYKWKENCGNCPQRYEEFPAFLYDASSSMLKDRISLFGAIKRLYVVGVSQWIANEGKQLVFKHANLCTIHNGIDTDFYYHVVSEFRKKHQLEGKFVILAPANKWFLRINSESFEYFAKHLDNDMRIVFFGDGADESRMNANMINIGYVHSREEIREIYSAVDVMVNFTREESLSLLNVEVQACGTPVITYSNTGVKETVDGECGFAVENGNPEAAWKAMMQIKKNTKTFYSANCQIWVKKEFDRNKNYTKYISLYKDIVK